MRLDVIHNQDCLEGMRELPDNSVDLVATDPPYGIAFMGRAWDRAMPPVDVWREALRVLKPGAFLFCMCIPRQDCLARMVVSLEEAGFNVSFSPIFHTFASGFPKAQNIGKVVDKRLGVNRKPLGLKDKRYLSPATETSGAPMGNLDPRPNSVANFIKAGQITKPASPQAQALDGSYGGFQPKPAVEVILVAMKPLSEKSYVDQALQNGKGVTWLDEGRIPFEKSGNASSNPKLRVERGCKTYRGNQFFDSKLKGPTTEKLSVSKGGRFPANLLASDDALNDGRVYKTSSQQTQGRQMNGELFGKRIDGLHYGDSGSFSRYFSLDAWFAKKLLELPKSVQRTFPFLIVPKASKAEKNRGCENIEAKDNLDYEIDPKHPYRSGHRNDNNADQLYMGITGKAPTKKHNFHPTCKPIKLMCYLVTLGSRKGDVVLDPFIGSGTTAIAARMLRRRYVGYETDPDYCRIAEARLAAVQERLI